MAENTGFDKTPTPPIDYDRNKIPESVKRRADYVRTKFTGEDVLEAVAQSGEIAGLIANEAHKKSNETEQRQDVLTGEFATLKPLAESSIAKADEALSKSENTQTQLDTIVISGDSSPAADQARVGADGTVSPSLKSRLDKEHKEVTAQLAQAGVNVKTFGALGDGVTDDTEAIKNGINYVIEKKLALFIPPGTFMVRPNVLEIYVYDNLYIYGVGELSQIKVFDSLNNSNWLNMFHLKINTDVDKIEIKNLYVNQNAAGSEPPVSSYDYEQSHTFRINVLENVKLREISFDNVRINDPVADGFNNSGQGTVYVYKVLNSKVTNRTRVRSDIQLSHTPHEVLIDNFQGDAIESESLSSRKTNIRINNTIINRLDGDVGPFATVYLNNTTVNEGAYFNRCKIVANNSEIKINSVNRRWNRLVAGSKITNCTIYIPYNLEEDRVVALDLRSYPNQPYKQEITFTNCDFLIDCDDDTITPSGYLIDDQGSILMSDEKKPSKKFINCFFDTRAARNIQIYRSGNWYFDKCEFSGTDTSIRLASGSTYSTEVHINDADFSNVTKYALSFESYGSIDSHLYINLYMTGYAKGNNSTNFVVISSNINRLISERILINHSGNGGIKGDRKSSDAVNYIGEIATTSSPTNANWKKYGAIEL